MGTGTEEVVVVGAMVGVGVEKVVVVAVEEGVLLVELQC